MPSASRNLSVQINGNQAAFKHASAGVMVEVRGPDRALVERRVLQINDQPSKFKLGESGLYLVRATLGSGRMLEEVIEHDSGGPPPPVRFHLHTESPHETLERTATIRRLQERSVGSFETPDYMSAWVCVWERASTGTWTAVKPPIEPPDSQWSDDVVRYRLKLRGRQYVLQVGGVDIPPIMACLPAMGACEIAIRPVREPNRHPIEIAVLPGSAEATTMLGYLGSGAMRGIDSFVASEPDYGPSGMRAMVEGHDMYSHDGPGPDEAEMAELLLYRKMTDPNAAALGGYFLLRTGELDRLHSWPANLANWMQWMSDGPIIRGWQLMLGAPPRKSETPRGRFLEAVERGLPVYAEGLRLLIDGLKALRRESPNDTQVATAVEAIGPYSAAADWSEPVLTFTGSHPDTPTSTLQGLMQAPAGSVMLHSITVQDLVERRFLRPGTMLRASPRRDLTVTSFTDEVAVSDDGRLDAGLSWIYPTPDAALLATESRSDGWNSWATPDGLRLAELRHRARTEQAQPESAYLGITLVDAGLNKRTVRALDDAGLRTVGDVVQFGPTRLEGVKGIGPASVISIREALTDRGYL